MKDITERFKQIEDENKITSPCQNLYFAVMTRALQDLEYSRDHLHEKILDRKSTFYNGAEAVRATETAIRYIFFPDNYEHSLIAHLNLVYDSETQVDHFYSEIAKKAKKLIRGNNISIRIYKKIASEFYNLSQ